MNGNSNLLAWIRRRKTGGAIYAVTLLLAAQLAAAATPCFAFGDGGVTAATLHGRHAAHGVSAETLHGHDAAHGVSADSSHVSHAHGAGHGPQLDSEPHMGHSAGAQRATELDTEPDCPHCPGGVPAPGGLAHGEAQEACATIEIVDTAPQFSLESPLKLWYSIGSAVAPPIIPQPSVRASRPGDLPLVPLAVPLHIRHCVFLI